MNRELEAKARSLAGLKGYTTNLTTVGAEFVIDAYHRLWRIEKASGCPTRPTVPDRSTMHPRLDRRDRRGVFGAFFVSRREGHSLGYSIPYDRG